MDLEYHWKKFTLLKEWFSGLKAISKLSASNTIKFLLFFPYNILDMGGSSSTLSGKWYFFLLCTNTSTGRERWFCDDMVLKYFNIRLSAGQWQCGMWDAHVTHCPVQRRWRGGRKVLCSAGSVRLYSGAGDVACVDTVDTGSFSKDFFSQGAVN